WRRGLVHPRDADAWKTAFIDVEGGGRGQLVVSAADDTWRAILCWGSTGRRVEIDHEGIPTSLSNLQGATEPLRNALDGDNYFRNLYSVLLGRDVGSEEFDTWLAGVSEPPPLTLQNLEQWLSMTKANVVVWSHRGSGDNALGPVDEKTNLRPPALHVGVREGHVYRLEVDGPWRDRFGSSLDVAIERSVKTQRRFRRIAEAVEEEEEPDTTGCGSRTFLRVADIEKEIMSMSQRDKDYDPQSAQKQKRGTDTSAFTTWYSPPGTALDELMLHLHIRGISCKGKLTNYSHWDSLTLPSLGITIRTWCAASMGGLDPNDFRPGEATRLIELQNALGQQFYRRVMDFRVSSQYSQSLLALLEICWRGPIVGAEQASGTSYGPEDWQCDINGAHTAALLSMDTVSVFAHMDEVQEYDDHEIEDLTLYVVRLDDTDPDVYLNADVTPITGRNYKRYIQQTRRCVRHQVTHFVKPARTVERCHIPYVARELLTRELGDPLLEGAESARKFKKGIFVRTSGMLQQRYADRIDAVMVTGSDEALAVGGKVVPVLGEVQHVKAGLRTGHKELGFEPLATGDAYLCFEAKRTRYRDGFWTLGEEILDQTRLRVLEVRNALESCGASDFSYQCDAVFFKGSPAVKDEMRLRFGHLFSGELNTPGTLKFCPALKNPQTSESRVFHGIETKLSLSALPPALRQIPCPPKRVLRVVPLWDGIGTSFPSMDDTHRAWLSLTKDQKLQVWPEVCETESPATLERLLRALKFEEDRIVCAVTGEHGGAGKSYCATRAATTIFKTGLVVTPTNSLRTSFTDMPRGWSVKTADHQLGFYLGDDSHVKKTAGSIRTLKVDVIIIEEAAYMPLRTLSMILAAAHCSGTHVIGTYDTHQLQPVEDSSGMSTSRDNVDRRIVLERAFPTCFHLFARKRDKT
ncbi:unnamed protein product, partial [Hapterophycus canaliculatus]